MSAGRKLFLVSCVSKKRDRATPARELYCSDWFRKARASVECQGAHWFILSAKYGLVAPNEVIEPYDETLNNKTDKERREWSKRVLEQLQSHCPPGTCIVFYAGEKYRRFLVPALKARGCEVEIPMEGLKIGEQLCWLSERAERCQTYSRE